MDGVMRTTLVLVVSFLFLVPAFAAPPFVFRDVGEEAGIFPHLTGIAGHGAAWGDIDNDGWVDLFVGTFHKPGTKPNLPRGAPRIQRFPRRCCRRD